MSLSRPFAALLRAALFCLVPACFAPAASAAGYEAPPVLSAAKVLPAAVLRSNVYAIADQVANDGFVNAYEVRAFDRVYRVESTLALLALVRELDAIEAMAGTEKSQVFLDSLKESGAATAKGVRRLFTEPEDTVHRAFSGLGRLIGRTGAAITGGPRGAHEDTYLKQAIGFSQSKREIAFHYRVDVYSGNELLQSHLDRLAWAHYAGGLSLNAMTLPVGGVAGLTLTTSGAFRLLGEVLRQTPPAELEAQNRDRLLKLGVDASLADLFLANPAYPPSRQTMLAMALERLAGVRDLDLALEVAVQAQDEATALEVAAMIAMYSGYHRHVARLVRLRPLARLCAAIDAKGRLVVLLPADYVTWNPRLDRGVAGLDTPPQGAALWVLGQMSDRAAQELAARKWRVVERAAGKLGLVAAGGR